MSRLLRILCFVCTLAAGPATAGPLDTLQPGQWFEAPNSHMEAVDPCPSNTCVYSGSQQNVINAWNSGAYDTQRDRLILWGGGHGDYGGNEIYVFDINSLTWTRLTDPSTNVVSDADPFPDGTPNPRHTYGTSLYIPSVDSFWVAGGALWHSGGCLGSNIWMYDFGASSPQSGWHMQESTVQGIDMGDCGGIAAYDAAKNRVILLAELGYNGGKLFEFDLNKSSSRWTVLNDNTDRMLYQTAAFDPKRRKFVVVGAGVTWVYDVDKAGAPRTRLSTSGATSIESTDAPGLVYDPVSDRIVAWAGGQNVYTLNMDTSVWELRTPTNSVNPGSVTASGGTWGRFQYVPSKNVFVLVNSTSTDVFFYKLSSGTGIPAPQQPAKPNVTVK